MKYRLRSLMIAVTLICVGCGRIGYLVERAQFHRREAHWYMSLLKSGTHEPVVTLIIRHSVLADAYGYAAYHPWTIIDEQQVVDEVLPTSQALAPNPHKP